MRKHLVYFLIVLPLLLSLTGKDSDLSGNYSIKNTEWGGHRLSLTSNGRFTEVESGCVFTYQTSGNWNVNQDTLFLHATEKTDLRSDKSVKIEPYTRKFVVMNNALYQMNSKTGELVDEEFSFVKSQD